MSAPWMKFYPTDWRADPALRVCSLAARGLWIEMLCVMHEASPRGSLRINGNPMSPTQIASLVGGNGRDVQRALDELEAAGVFSRDDNRVIFSRRMVRDTLKAERDKANGKDGGNPTLIGGVNPPDKGKDKAQKPEARSQKLEPPPSEARPLEDEGDVGLTAAVEIYNAAAKAVGWPRAQRLTAPRKASCRARLRECGGIPGWEAAISKAAESPFLCGDNERGWKASFDWLCQAKNLTKLMEGTYDRSDRQPANGKVSPHETILRSIARVVEKRGGLDIGEAGPDVGVHDHAGPAPRPRDMDDDLEIPAALRRH